MTTCRFCKNSKYGDKLLKYGVRHYAHHACYIKAGKSIEDLHGWQVASFPYRILRDHGLLARAEEITAGYDSDPENVYDTPSVRQSIEEDRK
jgi:hypothetical protein